LEYSSYDLEATKETLSFTGRIALKGLTRAIDLYELF